MPSVVQHKSTHAHNVTSTALAFASNNAAGNLLGYCSGGNQGATMNAPTDNNTNTIANATSTAGTAPSGPQRIDYVANSHSGANTVTANINTTSDLHLHLWEISGCVTVSPVRDSGTVASSATASVSTGGTSSLSGDAVLAFFYDNPNNDTLTAGSGFGTSEFSNESTGLDSALSEYTSAASGGTQTATCSGNGTNVLSQAIAVFKQAAASFVPDEDFWQGPMPPPTDPNIILWQ